MNKVVSKQIDLLREEISRRIEEDRRPRTGTIKIEFTNGVDEEEEERVKEEELRDFLEQEEYEKERGDRLLAWTPLWKE